MKASASYSLFGLSSSNSCLTGKHLPYIHKDCISLAAGSFSAILLFEYVLGTKA